MNDPPTAARRRAMMIADLAEWSRFLRREAHVFVHRPWLVAQQALNAAAGTAPRNAALTRVVAGRESRWLIRRLDSPESAPPCQLTLAGNGLASCCAVNADGSLIAAPTGPMSLDLGLWDAVSGLELGIFPGHSLPIRDCVFSPDGATIATASLDGTLRLWDVQSGRPIRMLRREQEQILACRYAPDGRRIFVGTRPGGVLVWDLPGDAVHRVTAPGTTFLALSPDGCRLATTGEDRVGRVVDLASATEIGAHGGHAGAVLCAAFSPDGARVATGGGEGTLRLWRAADGEVERVFAGHLHAVARCAFTSDGRRLATASWDGTVRLWDAETGEAFAVLTGHDGWVTDCAFSGDGRSVVSSAMDGTIRVWDATVRTMEPAPDYRADVTAFGCAADGRTVVSATGSLTLCVWDLDTGLARATLRGHRMDPGTERMGIVTTPPAVNACAFSPDGSRVVSASRDFTLRLWDAASGAELGRCEGHLGPVNACAVAPGGTRIASGSSDTTVRLWDAATGREAATLTGHVGPVNATRYSADGSVLASASDDGTARLWDAARGIDAVTLTGHAAAVVTCAFSAGGQSLFTGSWDGTVRRWRVPDGAAELRLEVGEPVLCCDTSPDGRWLAVGALHHPLELRDAGTGRLVAECPMEAGCTAVEWAGPLRLVALSAGCLHLLEPLDPATHACHD